ncbi:MAG: glycosyltransferase [Acidimicrobiia bacterium]|nr:glycosyltransferase [Acidimicrobiia bacterium]
MEQSPAPLIVLSGHRTGSSAVAGLLAASGLHVGDLIPPSPDNRGGYYENEHVLRASKAMLARRSRDWTCPPPRFEPVEDDLADVHKALDNALSDNQISGFKDPRTLFLLPAWLEAIPAARIVGVSRPVADVAASIQRRDGFSTRVALGIAELYEARLRSLQEQLRFPVIEFGPDPAAVLKATEQLVAAIEGLSWDAATASELFDPELVHHRSESRSPEPDTAGTVDPIPASVIRRELDKVESVEEDPVLWAGPAFKGRRRDVTNLAFRAREDRGLVIEVVPHIDAEGDPDHVSVAVDDLQSGADVQHGSHVLATDALDYVEPAAVGTLLERLDAITDHDGVCVLGGFVIDSPKVPVNYDWPGAGLLSHRDRRPYVHHRSELESALVNSTWLLGHLESDSRRRSRVLLVKSEHRRWPHVAQGHELRQRWPSLEAERLDAQDKASALRKELAASQQTVRAKDQKIRALEEEFADQRSRSDELQQQAETREADLRDQLDEITAELERQQELEGRLRKDVAKARDDAAAAKDSAQRRKKQLDQTALRLERLRNRRSVRFALGLSALGRPLFRWVRRLRTRPAPAKTSEDKAPAVVRRPKRTTAGLVTTLKRQRADVGTQSGPLVSIVVVTRDGFSHLARLLPGLRDKTAYRNFELVVVDNGSSDGTAELLGREWGFDIAVVRNEHNTSFSVGNNLGIAAAKGEMVLLLNNDVDPINAGWLGAMVETLTQTADCGSVGALLVYPEHEGDQPPPHALELAVQHRGIRFTWLDGAPRGVNQGRGEDPADPRLNDVFEVPAATAACLLMRTSTIREIGGLTEDYVYGTEDVELGLKLRELGLRTLVDGRAALFHHEFGTQDELANEIKRINRMGNRQTFAELWGPRLARTLRFDTFEERRRWLQNERPVAAITLTRDDPTAGWGDWYTAHELGEAFERIGWEVRYAQRYKDMWYDLDEDIDVVISLLDSCDARQLPEGAYKIAWIRNWVDRWVSHEWIDAYDLVLASSDVSMDIIAEQTSHAPEKIPLATNTDRFSKQPPHPTYVSDYAFTGNYWGKNRDLIDMLEVRPGERFVLFGKGWEDHPRVQRYWRGHLSYDQLPNLYSNTKIVLDDTAGPTKPYGAVNSRVFDAIACGALVLTDNVIGAEELFGELLPTYTSRAELRAHLDRYLNDDDLRRETVEQLRAIVEADHTYDIVAARIVAAARESIAKPKVAIKIGPPDHAVAERWGDTHFARALARGLRRCGYQTDVQILPEWDSPSHQDADVVVHLRGLVPYVPRPSQVNVLWIISHPEDVTADECNQYDIVLVASDAEAARLDASTTVPAYAMHQATDILRFVPTEPDPDLGSELLFVGNSRKTDRVGLRWAIEANLPLTVYGADWEDIIEGHYVKDTYFPNERLNEAYASASIVFNDHWPDMRSAGIVSNRIFDALACGAFVVSDEVAGLDDLFDGAVPTYSTKSELRDLVNHYLSAPDERKRLAEKGMEIVRRHHSFDVRARELDRLVRPYLAERSLVVREETGS